MQEIRTERLYLYVPPEEYAEVQAAGGSWDSASKRWYIQGNTPSAAFLRWLDGEGGNAEFGMSSSDAFVASAMVACVKCHETIEVICIYCETGVDAVRDEPLTRFTLSNVCAIGDALAAQLKPWPFFKETAGEGAEELSFVNHCPHCGAVQEDYALHSEPGDVFFDIPGGEPGSVELVALVGLVELSGDIGFSL